jgi:CBS domain-containing protein
MPNTNQGGLLLKAHPITARSTVRAALQLMAARDTHVLPVIDDQSGRAVGIVLRQALERGCLKMGHDPDECVIAHHTLREVLGAAGVRARSSPGRSAAGQYRVLLDGAGYPLAILKYS